MFGWKNTCKKQETKTGKFFVTVHKCSPEKDDMPIGWNHQKGFHGGSGSWLHLEERLQFSKAEGNREVIPGKDRGQSTEGK